jgi:hypothetical protein
MVTASAAERAPASVAAPKGDPNLVSMFDGRTLTGWTASKTGQYTMKDNAAWREWRAAR